MPRWNTPEDFWNGFDKSGPCWLWTRCEDGKGYGSCSFGAKTWKTHRLAWILTHGPVPDGLDVCHNCPGGDNRLCGNPAHLFLGTHADNNPTDLLKAAVDAPELPWPVKAFVEDTMTVLRIQLVAPGRTLRSITVKTTFWPDGTTTATESYPKPKAVPS
jgi:hypothetical protein